MKNENNAPAMFMVLFTKICNFTIKYITSNVNPHECLTYHTMLLWMLQKWNQVKLNFVIHQNSFYGENTTTYI